MRLASTRHRRIFALVLTFAAIGSGLGSARAGDVLVDPQCMGSSFTPTSQDRRLAAELMSGRLTLSPHPRTALHSNPRWDEDPFHNTNWVFQYQSLRWTDPLRREGIRTSNVAMLQRYLFLVQDWVTDNPYGGARSPLAWYDMAVGIRAIVLVCASELAQAMPWMVESMVTHAQVLSDAKEYRGYANHSLHQNIGLLALGCHLNVGPWQDLALERTGALLRRSVDVQGVSDEGSVAYQYLNYVWYSEARHRANLCGRTPIGPFNRLALMPTFLAHATKPNGTWVGLGDTPPSMRAKAIPATDAEYAATRGDSGSPPAALLKTYTRGYAFSRSGWFWRRPWWRESYMSLRYGAPMAGTFHSHEEAGSVTFFANGRDILWTQGFWGAVAGKNRSFVVDNSAHNVIDIDGADYRRDVASTLTATERASTHHLLSVRSTNLPGAVWNRTVLHVLEPGFLVVDDVVKQTSRRRVVQRWYVGADRGVNLSPGRASTWGPDADATFVWVGARPALSVARGRRDPMLGWRSMANDRIEPTPVIQASRTAKTVHFTTIIVPRTGDQPSRSVRVRNVSADGRRFDVVAPSGIYRVTFTSTHASVVRLS